MLYIDRITLMNLLTRDVLAITLSQQDGRERIVRCTLREEMIPPKAENKKKKSDYAMTVFDLDTDKWRLIKLDNIEKIIPARW